MTEDPKRWKDDESAPEAMREFLAASQAEAPALPDALREAVLRRVPETRSRVVPFVIGGVLALAAAALLALAMNTTSVQPAVPPPTLEPEPLDAGPDAPTLEEIEVERVCGEEDVNYACAVHIALPHAYEEVETRQAFGVAPPTCRSGYPFQPDEITHVDATHFSIAGPPSFTPQESIRVCAYEHGLLVATGSVDGQRQSPSVRVAPRRDRYDVFVSAERLDDDAEAVSLIRIAMEDFTGDGFINFDDEEPAIERIGCEGTEVARWSAESFNRIAALQRERGAVALVHRALPVAEGPPLFIACVETALGSERGAHVLTATWPEEEDRWMRDARVSDEGPEESIRAMPEEASECRIASLLEVTSIPEGTTQIGVAYRNQLVFRNPANVTLLRCSEDTLAVEMPTLAVAALTPDADGVRRIAFEFAPANVEEMGRDSERYCERNYEIIACVRDASGLHALPDSRARWTRSGPSCFTADTPIATPSGDVAIASLAPGMRVFAFDAESGARSETHVVRLIPRGERPIMELALSNGETMHVTAEHPLFDAEASTFREAGSFEVGDMLRGLDGASVRIISTRETGESAPVFDLSVAGPHTYFANGVVAHNY